jgi:HEAT repeat protein
VPDTKGLEALLSGNDDERWAAARAAGDDPTAATALGHALGREKNARVREAIFTSLSRIGTADSVAALLPFLRSDDANMRAGALDAMRAMKDDAVLHLPQLLRDADADIRLLTCELTRGLPAAEATGLLCGLLESEIEQNVCAAALDVLAELGTPDALPCLERLKARFHHSPFLAFSIDIAAERVRSAARA